MWLNAFMGPDTEIQSNGRKNKMEMKSQNERRDRREGEKATD